MIQSEEKSFKQYIKDKAPIQVIFKKNKEYIYTILDENFNVIFEHKAFNKASCFYNVIKRKVKELGLDIREYRNDDTIEDLKRRLYLEFRTSWLEEVKTDIEPNSKEFEEFKQNCIDVSLENFTRFVNE
jgi:hypothetical protein